MKTLITLVIPIVIALFAGSSAFAQQNYSRTGNYKEKATAERSQRHESASTGTVSQTDRREASHQYSRTGDYREPEVGQRNAQFDERSFIELLDEQTKVVAPASAPNRFGTTNR